MHTFRNWLLFEATKVVDAGGKPRVVWHGTRNKFDKFDKNWIGATDAGYYGRGFYFSPDKEEAAEYGPIVKPYYLKINNPFEIPKHGDSDHDSLLDLRDRVAALKGVNVRKTDRKVPDGYFVDEREEDNRLYNPSRPEGPNNLKKFKLYSVVPKPHLYGTDKEIYGRDHISKQQAVTNFNDERANDTYTGAWASQLLKQLVDRDKLADILQANGYDGIFVSLADTGEVVEYVAFEPEQIVPAKVDQ